MGKSKLLRRPLAPSKTLALPRVSDTAKKITFTDETTRIQRNASSEFVPNVDTTNEDDDLQKESKADDQMDEKEVELNSISSMSQKEVETNSVSPTPHTSFVEDVSIAGDRLIQSLNIDDIKLIKNAGPDPLPPRLYNRRERMFKKFYYRDINGIFSKTKPIFTLDDFKLIPNDGDNSNSNEIMLRRLQLSSKNYDELASFPRDFNKLLDLKKILVDDIDLPAVKPPRRPHKQLVVEMKRGEADDIGSKIYEPQRICNTRISSPWSINEGTGYEIVTNSSVSKFFQGQERSQTPLAVEEEENIGPAEAAVLNCLVHAKGTSLSLKAHFLSYLPNFSPLFQTLRWLNLSFNNLQEVPKQLFELKYLEELYLRNNPIQEIPTDIYKLSNLKTLSASHCLLEHLPESLYNLSNLEHIDFSYNRISKIHEKIGLLSNLRIINLEGNEIVALPCELINLNLKHLYLNNNYTHPLFWTDYIKNSPQPLKDVCVIAFCQSGLHLRYDSLPDNVKEILQGVTKCFCCGGPLYGRGLSVIRPAGRMFGVHTLPLVFHSCSPYCKAYYGHVAEAIVNRAISDG